MKRIVINLESYGDYDIPVSERIMLAPAGADMSEIKSAINSAELNARLDHNTDSAFKVLKMLGFESCKVVNLTVGGEL